MSQTDIDDLLGELEGKKPEAAPAKKTAAKAAPAAKSKPAVTKVTKVAKPAAKKAAAPAKPAAKAKPVAAKKAPAKATPAPAKKTAAKAAPAAKSKPTDKLKDTSGFIVFAEGEREALCKRIKQLVRKPTNSRELATKLEIHSRKLRRVLYGMERAGMIKLQPGTSRKHGMFALPA